MAMIEFGGAIDHATAVQRNITKFGAFDAGDFNGQAEVGQLGIDLTNGVLYINTGTKASTEWTVVGDQTDT